MKKAQMIQMILNDMYSKRGSTTAEEIDKRFKSWLNSQSKKVLEQILADRGI